MRLSRRGFLAAGGVAPAGVPAVSAPAADAGAAVANAVFHATGVRIRELPVRIETLLAS